MSIPEIKDPNKKKMGTEAIPQADSGRSSTKSTPTRVAKPVTWLTNFPVVKNPPALMQPALKLKRYQ